MRTPRRVKQSMYVAHYHEGAPLYDRDSNGNIIYDTMPDGTQVARIVGEKPASYDTPEEFFNSITGELTAEELQAFGSEPKEKAKMTYKRNEFDFAVGDLIWKESEVGYIDGVVDENSADYRVMGIDKTGRHFYKALLVAAI